MNTIRRGHLLTCAVVGSIACCSAATQVMAADSSHTSDASESRRAGCSHLRYEAVLLSAQDGMPIFGSDMNDHGQVIGYRFDESFRPHAFLWSDGKAVPLDEQIYAGAIETWAATINNRGQIAGDFSTPDASFISYLLQRRRVIHIEDILFPADMNDHGVLTGRLRSNPEQPAIWRRGNITLLPSNPDQEGAYAEEINDRGIVLGVTLEGGLPSEAVIWKPPYTSVQIIPFPIGATSLLTASALNGRGEVLLSIESPDGARAYIWHGGNTFNALPALPGYADSFGLDINNAGVAVGYSERGTFWRIGTIWRDKEACSLADLIEEFPDFPSEWLDAHTINERGEILINAQGPDDFAGSYLLRPLKHRRHRVDPQKP